MIFTNAWLLLYFLTLAAIFSLTFTAQSTSPLYESFRAIVSHGYPIARASAEVISFCSAVLLIPVCKNIVTFLRQTFLSHVIPFNLNIKFHRLLGMSVGVFSVVHVGAHLNNARLWVEAKGDTTVLGLLWTNWTTLTGIALTVILVIMMSAAISSVRRVAFESFFYSHHLYQV